MFVARTASHREHHVDQIGKYEIDKIDFNPPPPIEDRFLITLTSERLHQEDSQIEDT